MRTSFQLALQVFGLLVFRAVLLAPLLIFADEELSPEMKALFAKFEASTNADEVAAFNASPAAVIKVKYDMERAHKQLEEKRERKAEFRKGRLVEFVKEPKGKGDKSTNEVWRTGREFKTMFDRRPASTAKKGKGK